MSSASATDTSIASDADPNLDNNRTTDSPDPLKSILAYYADRPALEDTCVYQFGRDDDRRVRHEALDCPVNWRKSLKGLTRAERRVKLIM